MIWWYHYFWKHPYLVTKRTAVTPKKIQLKGKSSSKSACFKLHVGFFRAVSGSTVEVQKSRYITTVPSQQRMFLSGPSLPTLSRKATGFGGLGIESTLTCPNSESTLFFSPWIGVGVHLTNISHLNNYPY